VVTRVYTDDQRILSIREITNHVVEVSWPVSAIPFVLQKADELKTNPEWENVIITPTTAGDRNVITNLAEGLRGFYRLKTP
jgi:hypothetical protein